MKKLNIDLLSRKVFQSASTGRLRSNLEKRTNSLNEPRSSGSFTFLWLSPLMGYLTYLGLMWYWTGNPLEGFTAQKYWGNVHSIENLVDIQKFLVGLFLPTTWHAFQGSLLDRCVFLLFVPLIVAVWSMDKEWFVWALVLGLIPAMSGTFVSFVRFASVVFPMFIALGVTFSKRRFRMIGFGTLALFTLLHLILVWRFVNFQWAG